MKQNLGIIDRSLRTAAAILFGAFYFADVITGVAGTILALLAVVLFLTGVIGFCPLYLPFKFSSRRAENPA